MRLENGSGKVASQLLGVEFAIQSTEFRAVLIVSPDLIESLPFIITLISFLCYANRIMLRPED